MTIPVSWVVIFAALVLALGALCGAWVMFDRPDTAHWLECVDEEDEFLWYECSSCGEPLDWRSMYCPNCGRLMVEVKDGP